MGRVTTRISHLNQALSIKEWADKFGLERQVVELAHQHGWPMATLHAYLERGIVLLSSNFSTPFWSTKPTNREAVGGFNRSDTLPAGRIVRAHTLESAAIGIDLETGETGWVGWSDMAVA